MRRFILIGIAILLVIIGFIWLIASLGNNPREESAPSDVSRLVDYTDTSAEVRLTMDGKINAREDHRVIQIFVGKDYRSIQIFDGYQGSVLRQESYLNDRDAYNSFLAALQNEGYTLSRAAPRGIDPLGVCPLGQRYRYDIIDGTETKQSLWNTSCSKSGGTFAGRGSNVRRLFQAQIPNYRELTKEVRL